MSTILLSILGGFVLGCIFCIAISIYAENKGVYRDPESRY